MYIFFFLYGFCICIDSFAGDFLPCLSFYVIMVVLYMKICNIWKTDNVIYNLIFFTAQLINLSVLNLRLNQAMLIDLNSYPKYDYFIFSQLHSTMFDLFQN